MEGGFVARYGWRRWRVRHGWIQTLSEADLLRYGEPFLLHPDTRLNRVPLVRLFGPGRFWRVGIGDVAIVGEGHDGLCKEESLRIMDMRREGNVYGKWFSKFCPTGEFGARHYAELEVMSETDYLQAQLRLRR